VLVVSPADEEISIAAALLDAACRAATWAASLYNLLEAAGGLSIWSAAEQLCPVAPALAVAS